MRQWLAGAFGWWFAQTTLASLTPATIAEREFMRKSRLLSTIILLDLIAVVPVALLYIFATWTIVTLTLWGFTGFLVVTIIINRRGHMQSAALLYLTCVALGGIGGAWAHLYIDSGAALWQGVSLAITPLAAGLFLPFWLPFLFGAIECLALTILLLLPHFKGALFAHLQAQVSSPNFLLNAVLITFMFAAVGALYAHSTEKAVRESDRATELADAHTQLAAAYTQLEVLATTDPITGVLNHRAFSKQLSLDVAEAEREGHSLGLIFTDIDHFKRVNDTWGHQAGDAALAHVGAILRQGVGVAGTVARYGGEEFVILLPKHDHSQMARLAERLRSEIAATPCHAAADQPLSITASFGAALYPADADSAEHLVRAADSAMYQAKLRGRNRLCLVADVASSASDAA